MRNLKKIREITNTKAFRAIKEMMIHWGFTDTEAAIYALTALSSQDLTAREIASIIGRAYSSVVNEINKLIRYGLMERKKEEKCYHYTAVINMVQIVKNERRKILGLLEEAKMSIDDLNFKNEKLKENLNEVIEYLGKLNEVS